MLSEAVVKQVINISHVYDAALEVVRTNEEDRGEYVHILVGDNLELQMPEYIAKLLAAKLTRQLLLGLDRVSVN